MYIWQLDVSALFEVIEKWDVFVFGFLSAFIQRMLSPQALMLWAISCCLLSLPFALPYVYSFVLVVVSTCSFYLAIHVQFFAILI